MRNFFKIIFLFLSYSVYGQSDCVIGIIQNSNQISYNKTQVESIINLSKYNAYFFGESHTINFEPEFKFEFIKHLNEKFLVREIFMEIGHSAAYLFNQFLLTGDTNILRNYKLPYLWGQYKNFWNKLYNYNQTLPDTLKLNINGIDFERKEMFYLFEKVLPKNIEIPIHLKQTFADINKVLNDDEIYSANKLYKIEVEKLKQTFLKYENDFKTLYKDNYNLLYKSVTNKTPLTTSVNTRNTEWFKTIEHTITERQIKKFVCFLGLAHTTYNNSTSLTVALKNCSFFKGNILNISTMYNHFLSVGGANKIVEYDYKEKDVFDKYYETNCRATIINSKSISEKTFKTNSDFVLFAKDIIDK